MDCSLRAVAFEAVLLLTSTSDGRECMSVTPLATEHVFDEMQGIIWGEPGEQKPPVVVQI